jgi:hypothetical protein
MFHDGGCADLVCGLPGASGDFQDLSECAKRFSGCLGCVIGTAVSDDNYPQRVVPAGVAVGGEYTGNTLADRFAMIPRPYDNPDCPDSRW